MTSGSGNTSESIGLPQGAKVGKYEIRQRLAIGGQAVIYKAYDSLLDRTVAIKQISSHLAEDPRFIERFRKEAQILARLGAEQPAIATIHELIEDERGLFIVMDHVSGSTLESVLADTDGGVEPKAALQIIWRLASALHAVHLAGIVHRDMKPGNIMIGEGLSPTIIDFGLATGMSGQTSMVLGTTKYMAPELFSGGDVDGRADMYSLGMIAYEMLAGRPAFEKVFADIVRDPRSATVRWMKWHADTSMQAKPLNEVNPAVPQSLSDIVARMMAKKVEMRFQTMEALGRAIKGAFSRRGESTAPAVAGPRAGAEASAGAEPLAGAEMPDEEFFEPEPTAPLPKSALQTRTKLVLAGVIVLSLLAIGVVLGVRAGLEERLWREGEIKAYESARYDFDHHVFDAAAPAFEALPTGTEFPPPPASAMAPVLANLCRGYLAVAEQDWQLAAARESQARKEFKQLQRRMGKKLNSVLLTNTESDITVFSRYYVDVRGFSEAMDQARKVMKDKQFEYARTLLRTNVKSLEVDPRWSSAARHLLDEIDRAEFIDAHRRLTTQGAAMASTGDLPGGMGKYKEALKKLQGARGGKMIADAKIHSAMINSLSEKISTLERKIARDQAAIEVDAARAAGDKLVEIRALTAVIGLLRQGAESTGVHERRLAELKVDIELAKVAALVVQDKMPEATAACEKLLKEYPKDARVLSMLAQLKKKRRLAELIRLGHAAYDKQDWSEALARLDEARKLTPKGSATAKALAVEVADCDYRIKLARADRLRNAKKYDEALQTYEEARLVKRSADALVGARIKAMMLSRDYDNSIAGARGAIARSQFAEAQKHLRQAEQLRPSSPDIAVIRNDIRYRQHIALGKAAVAQKDYNSARGYFKVAETVRPTEEVRTLIKQMDKKLAEKKRF